MMVNRTPEYDAAVSVVAERLVAEMERLIHVRSP
jgi:hypothetical protein